VTGRASPASTSAGGDVHGAAGDGRVADAASAADLDCDRPGAYDLADDPLGRDLLMPGHDARELDRPLSRGRGVHRPV
jgi:hypothetical protein